MLHRNMPATPETFLKVTAPYRTDLVVAVEGMFTWYWLADLCTQHHIPFVLGHALYMGALHGSKAKNDRIDAHKIATLLRGGMLLQAYVYPANMRATRDLLRRRLNLVRKRAELLTHIHNTNSQYNLPALGKQWHARAQRQGLSDRFPDAAVQMSREGERHYLWRAVDQDDNVLDLLVQRRRNKHAAKKFFRTLLKGLQYGPAGAFKQKGTVSLCMSLILIF